MKRLLVACCLLIACTSQPRQRIPFPVQEYAALPAVGTGTVRGEAFARTPQGTVITAAGEDVFLTPVTSYTEQWFTEDYSQGRPLPTPDPRLAAYERRKTVNMTGRFVFRDVPPGDYYVVTRVTWQTSERGGAVATSVPGGWGTSFELAVPLGPRTTEHGGPSPSASTSRTVRSPRSWWRERAGPTSAPPTTGVTCRPPPRPTHAQLGRPARSWRPGCPWRSQRR